MRLVNPTNESVDEIGKKLLKAIRAEEQNIDGVVAAEDLFDPVRTAIRAGRRDITGSSHFVWPGFGVRHWQLAFASIAAIALGVFGVLYIVRQAAPSPEIAHETDQPSPFIETRSPLEIKPGETPALAEPARVTREGVHQTLASATRRVLKRQRHTQIEQVGEFQALTYTGDPAVSDNTGQIVRVELPRSSLFAMGVDVPVENQTTSRVKADLLIGDDGVMKAVRIVSRSDR